MYTTQSITRFNVPICDSNYRHKPMRAASALVDGRYMCTECMARKLAALMPHTNVTLYVSSRKDGE